MVEKVRLKSGAIQTGLLFGFCAFFIWKYLYLYNITNLKVVTVQYVLVNIVI